ELLATDRIPFAQFAQPPGAHARLPDADDPAGPVFLAGDYTRWSSIQGALESGTRAADAITARFDA
ncbi:FAD-dependent oxidoreductase, partial [Halolamina salina]|uniref:FAD-dependent oxidoreductase n=1 Tax=Halolamina salina TaxID=1220023 RepID=UPI003617C633